MEEGELKEHCEGGSVEDMTKEAHRKLTVQHRKEDDTKGPHVARLPKVRLSRQNVWRYICWAASLILQQVRVIHQMLT